MACTTRQTVSSLPVAARYISELKDYDGLSLRLRLLELHTEAIKPMLRLRWRDTVHRVAFVTSVLIVVAAARSLCGDDSTSTKNNKKLDVVKSNLPASVDLRPQFMRWKLLPKSQGKRNTCSVFATAGALEFAVSKHYRRGTPLSVEYLNWACNQVIHNETADRGQFFHDLLKGFDQHGICFDVNMPYEKRFDPQLKPSETALQKAKEIESLGLTIQWINPWKPQPGLTEEHLREIKTVLANGNPVAAGSSHSRLLVGFRDDDGQAGGGRFLAKDSGAGAFNTVTYDFVKQNVGDVFWVDVPAKVTTTKSNIVTGAQSNAVPRVNTSN
jgi:hypothetical protein